MEPAVLASLLGNRGVISDSFTSLSRRVLPCSLIRIKCNPASLSTKACQFAPSVLLLLAVDKLWVDTFYQ